MRLNVWGINYAPELTGIAVYNTQMCEYLASTGCEVTMVSAFPYYPSWRKRAGDRRTLYRIDMLGGVAVHRCWHYVPDRPTAITRMLHELTFVLTSTARQLALAAPDAYIVVSPPLLIGVAAFLVSRLKGRPFHLHVQDLQPDAAVGLSMLKPGALVRMLYWLERFAYDRASSVSAISARMREAILAKGIAASKVFEFPNWVALPQEDSLPQAGTWKLSRGIAAETTLITYCGSLGRKQGLSIVIEAAKFFAGDSSVLFVIAGDGADRENLASLKESLNLNNVRFEPVLPVDEHEALLVDSDICLVTQQRGSGSAFLPSKLLKTLSCGRPVLTNAEPDSALFAAVAAGGFGMNVVPDSPEALAAAISSLLGDPGRRAAMAEAGRSYVRQFDRDLVLPAFKQHLLGLARQS